MVLDGTFCPSCGCGRLHVIKIPNALGCFECVHVNKLLGNLIGVKIVQQWFKKIRARVKSNI